MALLRSVSTAPVDTRARVFLTQGVKINPIELQRPKD
jgi:hypothetical protein